MSQPSLRSRLFRRERHDEAGTTSEGLCLKILPFLGPVDKLFFWVADCMHTAALPTCQTDYCQSYLLVFDDRSLETHTPKSMHARQGSFVTYPFSGQCALAMRVESPTMRVGSRTQRISICQPAHSTSTVAPGRRQLTAGRRQPAPLLLGRRQPAPCLLELWSEGSK
jgi:hypothetical protein